MTTENSVYEINEAEHMVRRMHGRNEATPRQGVDGAWKAYESITPVWNALLITWGLNPDGLSLGCTITSSVVLDDGVPWD